MRRIAGEGAARAPRLTRDSAPVPSTPLRVPATDGFELAATWFGNERPESVLLIAPATGVRRRLYESFATHLAARGFGVLTWDWRGTGESRPRSLRGFQATMIDWATRDLAGVIDWTSARHPTASLAALGHSFGGQAIGLAPNGVKLKAVVTVAAQSGYWGHWPRPARYRYAMLWYVALPVLTHALGYFPARALGLGEELPSGVALQWARWCRRRSYLGDFSGHARIDAPLLIFSLSDDPYAPRAAVEALHAHYGSRARLDRHVTPRELGLDAIGHFGFFREPAKPLWEETARWLEAVLARSP